MKTVRALQWAALLLQILVLGLGGRAEEETSPEGGECATARDAPRGGGRVAVHPRSALPPLLPSSTVALRGEDGRIPAVGFGVFQSQPGDETYNAVAVALAAGYRHIDTAQFYENEADVARAIRDSGIPRSDVFVTSKLWPFGTKADDEGEEGESYALYKAHGELATELALRACLRSAELLGGYVDLMLLHSPHGEDPPALYRALQEMQRRGLARSIGVSNFAERHLRRLLAAPGIVMVPAVNQIELHPFLWDEERAALIAYCHREGIVVESYSPLAQAERMDHPSVLAAATKHRSTPGQVLLRWGLQMGWVVLPKSVTPERIRSNLDLGHLALDGDDMASLCRVGDEDLHVCWDPVKDVP